MKNKKPRIIICTIFILSEIIICNYFFCKIIEKAVFFSCLIMSQSAEQDHALKSISKLEHDRKQLIDYVANSVIFCGVNSNKSIRSKSLLSVYSFGVDTFQESESVINPVSIIINCEEEMYLGSSQQLSVDVSPEKPVNSVISYSSSNTSVLKVDAYGLVKAVGIGTSIITVKCGTEASDVTISVVKKIVPTDIDFEKPDDELVLNTSIIITATVLPQNAYDTTVYYSSSNPSILTVNSIGRVTGVSLGTAKIFLKAGDIQKTVKITVVNEKMVSSIEVSNFDNKMSVDSTQNLSVSLFPTDARDQSISYSSSDKSVATVSNSGVISAKAKGKTTITIKAGKAEKKLSLTVFVPTKSITTSKNYVILQPHEKYQIKAEVKPSDADQKLTYSSTNTSIIKVSKNGLITPQKIGRASVVIKNEDALAIVTVIVNNGSSSEESTESEDNYEIEEHENDLAKLIKGSEGCATITVSGNECPIVDNEILIALYKNSATLKVVYDNSYIIILDGRKIRNFHSSFPTDISLISSNDKLEFSICEGRNIPGEITIEFLSLDNDLKYLYFIDDKGNSKLLKIFENKTVHIEGGGKYVFLKRKISNGDNQISILFGTGGVFLIIGVIVFIATKRKYWFW